MELACCYIGPKSGQQCPAKVTHEINVEDAGLHPSENFLHACRAHVGAMLSVPAASGLDDEKVRYLVTPIGMVPTWA